MYWNKINDGCYEFTRKFGYAPNEVYMSRKYYEGLLNEMYGIQQLALIKHNSVRGLHVVMDYSMGENICFCIKGKDEDNIVQYKTI